MEFGMDDGRARRHGGAVWQGAMEGGEGDGRGVGAQAYGASEPPGGSSFGIGTPGERHAGGEALQGGPESGPQAQST